MPAAIFIAACFLTNLAAPIQSDESQPWHCTRCSKDLTEKQTEVQGHPEGPHGHSGPCQWRAHKGCKGEPPKDFQSSGLWVVKQKVQDPIPGRECSKCGASPSQWTSKPCPFPHPREHGRPCNHAYFEHTGCGGKLLRLVDFGREIKSERVGSNNDPAEIPALIFFAGTNADVEKRTRALRKDRTKDEDLPKLTPKDQIRFFLLWGPSKDGMDPLRRTRVLAHFDKRSRRLRITIITVKYLNTEGAGGGHALGYIGFAIPLGTLNKAEYLVDLFEVVETYRTLGDTEPKRGKKKRIGFKMFRVQD